MLAIITIIILIDIASYLGAEKERK